MKPQGVFCEWALPEVRPVYYGDDSIQDSRSWLGVQIKIVSRSWEEKGTNTLRLRTEDRMKRMSRSKDKQDYIR
jgi:hypothetical protein